MSASLKFESAVGTAATDLSHVKIITLADKKGNKYTLDVTGDDLKLEYTPDKKPAVEYKVDGLATALGSLLSTKDNNKSVLVGTLGEFLGSSDKAKYDGTNDQTAKAFLGGKGLQGADGAQGPQGEKGEKGDPGKDGKDGVQGPQGEKGLQGEKGDPGKDGAQGPQGEKGEKGLQGEKEDPGKDGKDGTSPSAAEIAADQALQKHIAAINIKSPEFKEAVQEEMSQPSFDIPPSDDAALNWTW
ncbi:collagen-like protein [Wolbachia endosymbiont (group A) of Andrena dorsata]|uniref:collagen-like protein n=1 Tax=Wolbachia endosymbiont (group A) of Andrena dorsata TaxID=2953975 RepID=UPI0022319361|nr:collagen-like protein [Wolbachia endosymbiont (group A) of Andrena dorsata]